MRPLADGLGGPKPRRRPGGGCLLDVDTVYIPVHDTAHWTLAHVGSVCQKDPSHTMTGLQRWDYSLDRVQHDWQNRQGACFHWPLFYIDNMIQDGEGQVCFRKTNLPRESETSSFTSTDSAVRSIWLTVACSFL